ncbi:MAG: exonuclease domain-containing protein [Methanosarcinales archaeon]
MKLKDCFPKDYIVLDTETSGLKPENDRILEIAVLKVKDRKPVGEPLTWLLNPTFPAYTFEVPEKITEITGITTEEIATKGMYPREALSAVLEVVGDSIIYAHNGIRFDRLFINAEFKRERAIMVPFQDANYLDSAAIFKAWRLGFLNWLDYLTFFDFANKILEHRAYGVYFNLKFCCETLAIDVTDLEAHRAGADVVMTYRVIEALRAKLLEPEEGYELRRAPGTCCPEPSCDYVGFDYIACKECNKSCEGCVMNKGCKRKK